MSCLVFCRLEFWVKVLPKIQAQNNEEIDEIRIIPVAVECLIRRGLGRLSFRIGRWYFNFG